MVEPLSEEELDVIRRDVATCRENHGMNYESVRDRIKLLAEVDRLRALVDSQDQELEMYLDWIDEVPA